MVFFRWLLHHTWVSSEEFISALRLSAVLSLVVTAAALLFCPAISLGQAGAPALIPMDNHSYDSINLSNLNVLVHAPVLSKSGAFPFSITFYANSYCAVNGGSVWECGAQSPLVTNFGAITANNFVGGSGWSTALPQVSSNFSCPDRTSELKLSQWSIREANGTLHPLPPTDQILSGGDSTCRQTSFTDTAIDGSGLTLTVTGGHSGYSASVVTSGGMTINLISPSGAGSITDSNGNAISVPSSSSGSYYDTLSTSAPAATASPNVYNPTSVSWTDVNGGSPKVSVTTSNVQWQTNFQCPGITDIPPGSSLPEISGLSYPNSTSLGITYEATTGKPGYVTGRIGQLTMPTGGTVSYAYTTSCTTGTVTKLVRTTSDGTTTYTNSGQTTTVTDNGGNVTSYTVTGQGAVLPVTQALTYVARYEGSSTLLNTDVYCYNGLSGQPGNCGGASVSLPISEVDVYHTINGMSTSSRSQKKYDVYGNVTYSAQYDFGASNPTLATTTTYGSWNGTTCVSIGNNINNKPCDVLTQAGSNNVSESRYTYDSKGNLLTTYVWSGSTWLSNSTPNSYNPNGTIATSYDLSNTLTNYGYDTTKYFQCSGCTNYPFPTSVSKGGLTTYSTWNGTGGVKLTQSDANGNTNTTTYGYTTSTGIADPFWRVLSVTDPLGNEVWTTYPSSAAPNTISNSFIFNSSNSIQSVTGTTDGYGRTINTQRQQSPTSSTYDTHSTQYLWSGNYREVQTTLPCPSTSGSYCSFSTATSTSLVDPLGRPYTVTDGGGGVVTKTYSQNDVLTVLSPAPKNENNKQFQREYDGLGRLTKLCAIGNGYSTACGQNSGTANGVTTSYSYTYGAGSSSTTTTRGSQSRTKVFDALGRVTLKTTPEGGTWKSYYDSYSTCPTGYKGLVGQLSAVNDPNGDLLCYAYDSLGRLTGVNANGTACRHFYYDNSTGYSGAIPSGVSTPSNSLGRMVEAATDSCSAGTLITDEWFSYDKDGRTTDLWQSSPHSAQYYHSVATYSGNGAVTSLQLASPSLYTMNYGLDGEGRWNTLTQGSTNIVTGPLTGMYDAGGRVLNVQLTGSTPDQDIYTYDPNTGRMQTFEFEIGNTPTNLIGALTWNPNGTLAELQITDGFNSGGSETCYSNSSSALGYGYDDWGRLIEFDCGSGNWGQQFGYDQYDNLSKSVISGRTGTSFNPIYTNTNQIQGATYDANGDLTNDGGSNVYSWNQFSQLQWTASSGTPTCGTSGKCITYDAFGRMVETSNGTVWTELWYTQVPDSRISMNASSEKYAYWPSPGRGVFVDDGGTKLFIHPDWLGNDRVVSQIGTHSVSADRAYAPYGEQYNTFGSSNPIFGMFAGTTGDFDSGVLYDTPNRELSVIGRWLSPDPAGAGWNQYAYPTNPNSTVDPSGLVGCNSKLAVLCKPGPGAGGGGNPNDPFGGMYDSLTIFDQLGTLNFVYVEGSVWADNSTSSSQSPSPNSSTPQVCGCLADLTSGLLAQPIDQAFISSILGLPTGAGDPAGIAISGFLFQYNGPNYYIGDDGNTAFLFKDAGMTDSIVMNVWYLQVVNGSGQPLAGNFTVTQDVIPVLNMTSPGAYDVQPSYTWTTNSTGGFIDNIGFVNPSGTEYMTNGQDWYINGVQANMFKQGAMYYNGNLVFGMPWYANTPP